MKEYQDFEFKVDDDYLKESDMDKFLSRIVIGDTINLKVGKVDFQAKISHKIEPTFFMKHINWDKISIYDLKHKGNVYFEFKNQLRN